MSSYSSVLRQPIWGGFPIAIPAMSVFAFLVFFGTALLLNHRQTDTRAAAFLFAAAWLPLLSSGIMGYLSVFELNAVCKLCIGIYLSSAAAFVGACGLWIVASKQAAKKMPAEQAEQADGTVETAGSIKGAELSPAVLTAAFAVGVLFVAVPVGTYAAMAPDFSRYIGSCGQLAHPADPRGVLLPIGPQQREISMIEVMDPLCAACGVFERRFGALPLANEVSRKLLLFPMDTSCNWMIDESIHPGACTVSEAILCAGNRAQQVVDWAVAEREAIGRNALGDEGAVQQMLLSRFPSLRGCLGSARVRARLNDALRWAVKNQLQVLTPQVYVSGLRLCDEDTDLGLDYALPRLVARARALPPDSRPRSERESDDSPGKSPALPGAAAHDAPSTAEPSERPERIDTAGTEQEHSPAAADDTVQKLAERAEKQLETRAEDESDKTTEEPAKAQQPPAADGPVEPVRPVPTPPPLPAEKQPPAPPQVEEQQNEQQEGP